MDRLMSDENQNPSIRSVSILRSSGQTRDWLAVEEPLEMRVNGESLAVVLRTPGNDPYADIDLALGFLATEGVIDDMDDIDAIGHRTDPNVVNRKNVVVASLAAGTYRQFQRLRAARRSFFVAQAAGSAVSRVSKTSFSKRLPLKSQPACLRNSSRSWETICVLINRIFLKQVVFMRPWRFGPMALFSSRLKISGVTMLSTRLWDGAYGVVRILSTDTFFLSAVGPDSKLFKRP